MPERPSEELFGSSLSEAISLPSHLIVIVFYVDEALSPSRKENQRPRVLQVGCWDGTAAVWRVHDSAEATEAQGMELLHHLLIMDGPVRGVAWAPPGVATATGDLAHRHLFTAVGHSDKLRVWDTRCACSNNSTPELLQTTCEP
jgi:hypothetical protein